MPIGNTGILCQQLQLSAEYFLITCHSNILAISFKDLLISRLPHYYPHLPYWLVSVIYALCWLQSSIGWISRKPHILRNSSALKERVFLERLHRKIPSGIPVPLEIADILIPLFRTYSAIRPVAMSDMLSPPFLHFESYIRIIFFILNHVNSFFLKLKKFLLTLFLFCDTFYLIGRGVYCGR